jgi:hypothetical protein
MLKLWAMLVSWLNIGHFLLYKLQQLSVVYEITLKNQLGRPAQGVGTVLDDKSPEA